MKKSRADKTDDESKTIDVRSVCGIGEFVSAKELATRIGTSDIAALEKELEENKAFKVHKSGDVAFYERIR